MDYLILTTYQKILAQFMVKKIETKRGRELPESWAERVKRLVPQELPGGPVVKTPPSNTGDMGSILGWKT